jgi:hypothetical protein
MLGPHLATKSLSFIARRGRPFMCIHGRNDYEALTDRAVTPTRLP